MLISFCAGHFFAIKDKLKYAAFTQLRVLCFAQRKNKLQQQAKELNNEGNDAGNKQNPNGVILGVEVVETNTKAHKVIVRGKNPDPTKVAERLQRKMDKHTDLISLILREKEEKKPESKLVEVVLKIFLHCDGCAKDIKYCIHEMEDLANEIIRDYPDVVNFNNEQGLSPLHILASKPSAFRSGCHLGRLKQIIYNRESRQS
ncbi:hypothetical protein RJ639_024646 [Escallonia herrerae]|uniref:Uncharacterized protein n=1 Tax=Escallonia herrerae TaxID=1293975 RepID=A0AA88V0D0_9ASTE|nr:hypothetical protein RJ639_024646 [Escallonia herrerae]